MAKSQLWYLDFIFGITLFVVILLVAFKFIAETGTSRESQSFSQADMAAKAIFSRGIPKNWTTEDVLSPGIVSDDSSLNLTKLAGLQDLCTNDYDRARLILGIGSDFIIYFENLDGNVLNLTGQEYVGKPGFSMAELNQDAKNIASAVRYIVLREDSAAQIISMKLIVWEK